MVLFDRRKSSSFAGIQLVGDAAFRARSLEALQLLRSRAYFDVVQEHIALIKQGARTGIRAWAKSPVFVVGKATWQHSVLWYAGAIAHDAYHSKLYHEAKTRQSEPPPGTWTGAAAEKKCLLFQRQVLIALNADSKIIAYIEELLESPTFQGRNTGLGAWLDYLKRWW